MTQTIAATPAEHDLHLARSVLDVESISVAYAGRNVIQDVSFQLDAGEVVGLIGESGSGKTTIARAVLGTVPTARGQLTVNGRRTTRFSARHQRNFRREGHAQYVFQDPFHSLDDRFTALQAVRQGARETFGKKAADEHARNALQAVQLHERLWHRRPGGLSGGQRQRVAIARALAVEPAVLVCDEPVSALDASSRIDVVRTLRRTADARTGILLISHDLSSLSTIADRILVLNEGRIVESGTTAEVLGDPQHPYTRRLIAAVPTIEGATGQSLPAEPEPETPTAVEHSAQRALEFS